MLLIALSVGKDQFITVLIIHGTVLIKYISPRNPSECGRINLLVCG